MDFVLGLLSGNPFGPIFDVLGGTLVDGIVGFVQVVLGIVASLIFSIITAFIQEAIRLNSTLTNSGDSNLGAITDGYTAAYSMANLFLIATTVIAAFMVMFRRGDPKRIIYRIIIVAIFLPFGWFIATNVFIQPSNTITAEIAKSANFSDGSFAVLFQHVDIQTVDTSGDGDPTINAISNSVAGDVTSFFARALISSTNFNELAPILFTVAMIMITSIALFFFGVMLLVRYVALAFLLMLMPLAAVAWTIGPALPQLSNQFQRWWGHMVRWTLFAPMAMFFFWLAIAIANGTDNLEISPDPLTGAGQIVGQAVIIIGVMMGGLTISNSIGIAGGGMALSVMNKVKGYAKSKSAEYGRRGANKAAQSKPVQDKLRKAQTLGVNSGIGGRVVGAPIRGVGRFAQSKAEDLRSQVSKTAEDKFKGLSDDEIAQRLPGLSGTDKVKAIELLVKKNKTDKIGNIEKLLGDEKLEKLFKDQGKESVLEDIEKRTLTFRDEVREKDDVERHRIKGEKIQGMTSKDLGKIDAKQLVENDKTLEMVLNIRPDIIPRIRGDLNSEGLQKLTAGIDKAVTSSEQDLNLTGLTTDKEKLEKVRKDYPAADQAHIVTNYETLLKQRRSLAGSMGGSNNPNNNNPNNNT